MKIVVVATTPNNQTDAFLPKLAGALTAGGNELHLIARNASGGEFSDRISESGAILHAARWTDEDDTRATAAGLAKLVNELNPDVYAIWNAEAPPWAALPMLDARIATVAFGHFDSEDFYRPVRHYRGFLSRVTGATPEICVGLVLGCVIDKERVEWLDTGNSDGMNQIHTAKDFDKIVESYLDCFEKAVTDSNNAPRIVSTDFPLIDKFQPEKKSWFSRLTNFMKS